MLVDLYRKLFVTGRFFTISIRNSSSGNLLKYRKFVGSYTMPANRHRWYADPMLIETQGKTYMFYEAVDGNHGSIEVAEINSDCTIRNKRCIISDDCHYSYPFVFQYKGCWYMIPETSQRSEIRLYKAASFPYDWHLQQVLLKKKAVDTTVFYHDSSLYMLTYYLVDGSERVIPHAFDISEDSKGNFCLREIAWDRYDSLRVRGAGPVLRGKEYIYRPAQISTDYRYGDGLAFYRIKLSERTYHEECIFDINSSHIKAKGFKVDGLHTYSRSSEFEVIDVRCCMVDYFKIIKRFIRIIKR